MEDDEIKPFRKRFLKKFMELAAEENKNAEDMLPSQLALDTFTLFERFAEGNDELTWFLLELPLTWRHADRFSHCHIIGRTDAGKTNLLASMMANDLIHNECSIVYISPHGDLIDSFKSMPTVWNTPMLHINPRDLDYPPSFNPFARNKRAAAYSPADQERLSNSVIKTFDYIFSGLGLEFTTKQKTLWTYVVRLLLKLPTVRDRNATIIDILHLLHEPMSYLDVIDQLPSTQRDFFHRSVLDPKNKTFGETREQIANRISHILADPNMERLLTAPENKIDLFEELKHPRAILIDTADDFLGEGSPLFGGMMISLIVQAILERETIAESERFPCFVYVDEAATYFSDDIGELLTKVRKYKAGFTFAHHYLRQASPSLRASLVSQPAIRFAAPSHEDAAELAPEMNTSKAFLTTLPKHTFAMHIKGVTPTAVRIKAEKIKPKQRSYEEQQAYLWTNRAATSFGNKPAAVERPTSLPTQSTLTGEELGYE